MNWKKIVKGLLVLLLVLGPAGRVEAVPIAQAEERLGNYTGPSSGTAQDDNVKASLDLLHSKVGGGVDNIGTGNAFYVDSNVVSEGAGTSWIGAKDTLDEAVVLCSNNNGDVIYVAAGHNENWTGVDSADLDVIGITVIGLGKGSDRPRFDYDDVDAELVIGAANVKIYNLTFMPGYAEVVHAIEVEADADGSIVDSCEFFEGETPGTDEFLNAIQLITAADDIIISSNIVTETADGADSWLDASTGIVDNLAVVGNRVWGDYDLGGIYTNKACTNCYIADNAVTNLATGIAAIVFSGNATGTMVNNYASSDTPGTIVDPGYMQQAGNVEADEGANLDSDTGPAWAVSAPAGTGNYPDNVESESLISYILSKHATAAASTYVNTTDSLEMASDKLGAFTGDGGANDNDSVKADLDLIQVITAKIPLSDGTVSWNATALTAIEGEAIDAIEADSLNLLMSAADGTGAFPASVANDSCLAKIMTMDNTGVATTADYSNATMSLEALNVDLDAIITGTSNAGAALPSTKSMFDIVGETYTDDDGTDDLDDVYSHLKLIFDIVAGTATAGEVFYVDSAGGGADSSGYGVSWAKPCITIDYAEGLATASRGDIILVAPGHAENITAAGTDLTMAKAGVKVIGLGVGRNRPVLTFTTDAGADIECDNSVAFYNMVFDMTGIDAVTGGIDVDAADVQFHDCEFVVADAGGQVQYGFTLDAAAHRFLLKNCRFVGGANDGPDAIINLVATAPQEMQIIDCWFEAACDEGIIYGTGTPTDLLIQGCHVANLEAGIAAIVFSSTATGVIKDCTIATDTYATGIDPGTCRTFNTLWYDSDVPGDAVGIPVLAISAGGATQVSVADLDLVEAEATDALEADLLNFLIEADDSAGATAYPDSPAQDSILAYIMGDDTNPVVTTYNNTTDSLEALGTKTDTLVAAGQGFATKAVSPVVNGLADLFVVSDLVQVTSIVAIVTQIENKSCKINYSMDPTDPAGDTAIGDDGDPLDIDNATTGTLITWGGALATDLVATTNGVQVNVPITTTLVVPAGTLELESLVATSATGTLTFYIRYIPLVSGATITAAP